MRRTRRPQKGTTVVELAFTLPFLLLLLLGGLHYGWLFYHLQRVTNATRHATRIGTLPGRSPQDVKNALSSVLGLGGGAWPNYNLNVDDATQVSIQDVTLTIDGESVPGLKVGVRLPTATNPQVLLLKKVPFGPSGPTHLAASMTMALEGG